MKKNKLILLLIMAAGVVYLLFGIYRLCMSSSGEEAPLPLTSVRINPSNVNIGEIPSDTIVESQFVIYNTGNRELVIQGMYPDCTCTSFEVSQKSVAPGDSAVLNLAVDMKNKYGDESVKATLVLNTKERHHQVSMHFWVLGDIN